MKTTTGKCIAFIISLAIICGFSALGAKAEHAFAETQQPVLEVYCDDAQQRAYTFSELEQIWQAEGSKSYTYSGYNTYPSAKPVKNAEGPSLQGILRDALGQEPAEQLQENQLIEFVARDGIREGFLVKQILSERYYFPHFEKEADGDGAAVSAGSDADAAAVPAIISLKENGKTFGTGSGKTISDSVGRLLFGQVSPHEQNHAAYIRYLVADGEKASKIIIHSESAAQWNPVQTVMEARNGSVEIGTDLHFDKDVNRFAGGTTAGRYWICYTTDGSEPKPGGDIYNYNSNAGASQKYHCPQVTSYEDITIRTKVMGYGKEDSETATITLKVIPRKPAGLKAVSDGLKRISLTWTEDSYTERYDVYRAVGKPSGFTKRATVTKASYVDTGLKDGVTCYYKVVAHAKAGEGEDLSSRESATVSASVLAKPALSKVTLKSKKLTVKWKKVAGAKGYQVYRATKKRGSYKLVKTVKSGKTVTFKDKKVKKKKTYFYKVRAYRLVSGKKVYSSFSAVKYKKVK